MSTDVNTKLVEEAMDLMDDLSGTGLEQVMESNIARKDYDALFENLKQARDLLFDSNFRPGEVS